MNQDKRKLFVSFTSLLYQFKRKQVTPSDLQGGLFYLGCERIHLLEDLTANKDVELAFKIDTPEGLEEAVRAYSNIQSAVLTAEDEGRAAFRAKNGHSSFLHLNSLLEKNGINTASVKDLEVNPDYNLPKVKQRYDNLIEVMW